ncbi:hypothetical protein ACJMK2_043144 [Sinanodonta woodiana]|uniref:Spaetzle domain-containing protein n=1 Tax=Sinanodonta woodiana TaxID=1069815 RepID=A0ABD3VVZ7_SINWO
MYNIIWVLLTLLLYVSRVIDSMSSDRIKVLKSILAKERLLGGRDKRGKLHENDPNTGFDCCPTVLERISPLGGLSRDGKLLQLYRDTNTVQKFYEKSCAPDYSYAPCRFINQTVYESRCVQQFTYMYAIVKDFNVTQPFRVDYIKVKSGCTCKVLRERAMDL